MFSSGAPDTNSGRKSETPQIRRKNPARRRRNNGDAKHNASASCDGKFDGRPAAGVHAMVERDCTLLPATLARDRRNRFAAGLLAGNRLRLWNILSNRSWRGAAAV